MAAPGQEATESAPESTPLKRAIGPKLLLLFVIGDILGTGIYATTGKVAGKVGGALWAPFLIGFVVAILTAASYVELVGKYPKAAGAALYTQKAFKIPFLTFIVAFLVMCSGLSSASAAARAFGGDYFGELIPGVPTLLVALVFILALAALNYRGVSESVKANIVFTAIELTGLLVILAIGAYAIFTGAGEPARLTEFEAGDGQGLLLALLGSTALGFFAFVGFEDSVNMAEETKDPARNFPRAIFLGVAITGTVYVLVGVVSSYLVDFKVLEASDGPLLEVVKAGGVAFPPMLFAAIALFAVSNSALINMMMASRLTYGMANERILPKVFKKVDPRRQTPVAGIIFVTILAIGLISTGEIEGLGDTTAFLLLIVFTIVNVAVLVLRKETVGHSHFRAPTWMPVLGAVFSLILASPLADREADVYIRAGVLVVIGIILWAVNRLIVGKREADLDATNLTK